MDLLTNLNLGKNELQNARIQNLATAPDLSLIHIYLEDVSNGTIKICTQNGPSRQDSA